MSKLINCLINKDFSCKPVWFMRQAGRYLPEFRKIRLKNQNFIKLCLNEGLCSDITLQPIKRFDLDAAIIFSDILIVPFALNQDVNFKNVDGPKLSNFDIDKFMKVKKEDFLRTLSPVYKAISKTRKKLDTEKSLICFIGSPWTLLTYMLNIDKKNFTISDFNKRLKLEDQKIVMGKLNEFLKAHIEKQVDAGADIVQLFDSWAGLLDAPNLQLYCYEPNKELVGFCKEKKIPTICFPKGIKENYKQFTEFVKPDGINIDYDLDPDWVNGNLTNICIQGGMDPSILLENEIRVFKEVEKYLNIFKDKPYIFNLGHGILPNTNPAIIKKVVEKIRAL